MQVWPADELLASLRASGFPPSLGVDRPRIIKGTSLRASIGGRPRTGSASHVLREGMARLALVEGEAEEPSPKQVAASEDGEDGEARAPAGVEAA